MKEKQISKDIASAENIIRHAYNQGYEQGLKDSKQETCEQIKWERDTAIKQLNELGYGLGEEIKPCEDAVSRMATLEPYKTLKDTDTICVWLIRANILQQKSVNPQPKTGHWINMKISINGDMSAECDKCGCIVHNSFTNNAINYCPNCGAMLESEDKE